MSDAAKGTLALQKLLTDEQKFKEKMELRWFRTIIAFAGVILMVAAGFAIMLSVNNKRNSAAINEIQASALVQIENNRQTLLSGLYSVNQLIQSEIPTRNERFQRFVTLGKRAILEHNPNTDMTDATMNALLRENFELAERYAMSPWVFMAFAAIESDYTAGAKSDISSASGIVQFMPATMRLVLQEDYVPGIEFDPVWACRAWYKYVLVLNESVGGDLKWTAAAYMSPTAIRFFEQERTVEDFMTWITEITINMPRYPFMIEEKYHEYTSW
jgi:hypothetical protein